MAGIPAITPYPMPTGTELPGNTADWAPDPERAVLLIHDMQRYFLRPFPVAESPGPELIRNVTRLRDRCAELGVPVAYTAQPGGMNEAERGLLNDFWGPGMRVDPEDRQVIEPIRPADDDWVFTKWRYSAFVRTDLRQRMDFHHRDQLIICGVYAHVGVLSTALDAFAQDIQPFLVSDAVADFCADDHRLALDYAARRCAVVGPTQAVLDSLDAVPAVR